jgi:hypothetical protein
MENTGTAPSNDNKRPRTYSVVRRRYKRLRWIAMVAGTLVVTAAIARADVSLRAAGFVPDMGFYGGSIALLLAGAMVPWLFVSWLWHQTWRRNFWDWQ